MAAYLCRELTGQSYPAIGAQMGGRDHTTTLFSYRRVRDWVNEGVWGLPEALDRLRAEIIAAAEARQQREAEMRLSFAPPPEQQITRAMLSEKTGRTRWTVNQMNKLRELRQQKLSRHQIAEAMGRSVCAIAHKVKDMGLPRLDRHDVTAWMSLGGELEHAT